MTLNGVYNPQVYVILLNLAAFRGHFVIVVEDTPILCGRNVALRM